MRSTDSEVKGAGCFSFAAMQDAAMHNAANASHYSAAKKVRAERLKQILDLIYASNEIHVNFRKTFIAIKIENARVRNLQARNDLAILEKDWDAEGITRTTTAQGIIFHIPA